MSNYDTAKITYLFNSGFVVELGDCALFFDYFRDEKNLVPEILKDKAQVYFFVSHSHFDHFNPKISDFKDKVTKYFISYDVTSQLPPANQSVILGEYMTYENKDILVKSFSSTDLGISFYLEIHGWKIFHAGDFNWWYWKGDTAENIAFARNGFKKQMKRLDGLFADIAFFPVDSRLEEFWDIGAKEFCSRTHIKNLITMHNTSGPKWKVPKDFPNLDKMQSVWVPDFVGQSHIIKR